MPARFDCPSGLSASPHSHSIISPLAPACITIAPSRAPPLTTYRSFRHRPAAALMIVIPSACASCPRHLISSTPPAISLILFSGPLSPAPATITPLPASARHGPPAPASGLPSFRPRALPAPLVRKGGFEPPRLSAPPPQDGVSASSTTSA